MMMISSEKKDTVVVSKVDGGEQIATKETTTEMIHRSTSNEDVHDAAEACQEIEEQMENGVGDGNNNIEDEEVKTTQTQTERQSHMRNTQAHSVWVRYGIPVYLLGTLGLLLASDIGSGVAAEYLLINPDGSVFEQEVLLEASIFTSVAELWHAGSYALAILIVITSIMWPYVKLLLSLFAWVVPYPTTTSDDGVGGRRRERLLECVDALGKWSFVDIFVLLIIMVSFRATIELNAGVSMEVVVVPRWGFFGFVLATMLSLVGTHVILYKHRRVIYKEKDDEPSRVAEEEAREVPGRQEKQALVNSSHVNKLLMASLLTITLGLIVAGCVIYIFEVTNRRGETVESTLYSVLSVGAGVPAASLTPNAIGVRFIQAMYYLLGFALPLLNIVMFGTLYSFPMTTRRHKRVFMAAEICFSWSSIEVLLISCIFSVVQIPKFGTGLIKSGCQYCYTVGSSLLPELSVLGIASAMSVAVNIWLYRRAHAVLYPSSAV